MYHASFWQIAANGVCFFRRKRFASEIERIFQLSKINCSRGNVLRMHRQLGLRIPLQAMHASGRLELLHRVVPFVARLLLGLLGFLRSHILHGLLRVFLGSGHKLHHLPRAGRHVRAQRKMFSVGQHKVSEGDFNIARRTKIAV